MDQSRKPSVQQILRKAQVHAKNDEFDQAKQLYSDILKAFPNNKRAQDGLKALGEDHWIDPLPQSNLDELVALYNSGQLANLVPIAEQLALTHPNSAVLYNLLGVAKAGLNRLPNAIEAFRRAVDINPAYKDAQKNLASTLQETGALDEAEAIYKRLLEASPNYIEALNGLGVTAFHKNDFADAIGYFERCLEYSPDNVGANYNLGLTHQKMDALDEAIACFHRTIEIFPNHADAMNSLGIALYDKGEINDAITSFSQATTIKPDFAQAFNNLGNALKRLGGHNDAIDCYKRALEIEPEYVEAHTNLGDTLREQGSIDDALTLFDRAHAIDSNIAASHFNLGLTHALNDDPPSAIAAFTRALELDPDFDRARAEKLQQHAMICDWAEIEKDAELIPALGTEGQSVPPFSMLTMEDAPNHHRHRSEKYCLDELMRPPLPTLRHPSNKPERLRVGYFSADFHNHATMWLMGGLFAAHDRQKFEIFTYSYGPDQKDDTRSRLIDNVDGFRDVQSMDNEKVAKLAREDGIDIAVDLKGLTANNRLAILAYRPAPVQIHYLGYPGTTGAPFIDYLIADNIIVPEEKSRHYLEKIISLPHSYQVNDDAREILDRAMTREEFFLPEDGFVFCCFNNNYKIMPAEFDIWMRLLHKVKGSVLWLLRGNQWAEENLRQEAMARGIFGERIVFADRLPMPEHLARHRLADLFLDTINYNAHTTMSDALWAGLPAVTKIGEGFATRVGASLLSAIGMPELITHSLEDYESLIYQFATNPDQLSSVRSKLEANRMTKPLFNTALFTKHLEDAYMQAYQNFVEGHPPRDIKIRA